MNKRKTIIRFFTIADYEDEEVWLHNQHKNGWKLLKMIPPCFYIFEECVPEDVVYRLDYKNNKETSSYFQIFRDYGWEYIGHCIGWLYFRKPLSETDSEQDVEIFSDNKSKLDMINHVIRTRMLPLLIVFLCCVLPDLFICIKSSDSLVSTLTGFPVFITLFYIYLLTYCSLKLRKLEKKYRND